MHAGRPFSLAVFFLAAAVAGCTSSHPGASTSTAEASRPAAAAAAAPKNPDYGTVVERYYQLISSRRWPYAFGMLTPRFRATMDLVSFQTRYLEIPDPSVHVVQTPDGLVLARLEGKDRNGRLRSIEETLTFIWDGTQWRIDDIRRREISLPRTR